MGVYGFPMGLAGRARGLPRRCRSPIMTRNATGTCASPVTRDLLYPTREAFLKQWQGAVDQLVTSQAILAEDAAVMKARGFEITLPSR